MTAGGAATDRDGAGRVAGPWPNAAQRAAARQVEAAALERSRARRLAEKAARAAESGPVADDAHVARPAPPAEERPLPGEPVAPLAARPRIEDDTALLGLTRRSNSRVGQRVFNLFFLCVFLLIAAQMVVALLSG